jgi:Tol biopolymer transport system component
MRKTQKISRILFLTALGLFFLIGHLSSQQTVEELFEKAMVMEEAQGDLQNAIGLYEQVLKQFPENREIAAKAQLHIGLCYEKLGLQEAPKAFQKVLNDFPDQKETVKIAREKLSVLLRIQAVAGKGEEEFQVRKLWDAPLYSMFSSPSSDGKYLAYSSEQDFFSLGIRDLVKGESRLITHNKSWLDGEGYCYNSTFSSNASQIAYCCQVKDKLIQLRIVNIDGTSTRILRDGKNGVDYIPFGWTTDGKQILTASFGHDNIAGIAFISAGDGSIKNQKTLSFKVPWGAKLSLSPDGKYIAGTYLPQGDSANRDIFLLSIDRDRETKLVEHPANDILIGWSPDGRQVLFTSDRTGSVGIWTVHVSGEKAVGTPEFIRGNMGNIQPLGMTRDGKLYYEISTGATDVFVASIDPATGKVTGQPKKAIREYETFNSTPDWSPDGQFLVCRSSRGNAADESPGLLIRSMQTNEVRELIPKTPGGRLMPFYLRWSPDGSSFISIGKDEKGNVGALLSVDAKTGEAKVLARSDQSDGRANIIAPDWSSDGKTIYFVRIGNEFRRVCKLELETGVEEEIYRSSKEPGPFWLASSPDGQQLAINEEGKIRILFLDSGESRELTGSDCGLVLAWMPDGKNILFGKSRKGRQNLVELWRMPATGGEPQKAGLSMSRLMVLRVSPDGKSIAFTASEQPDKSEVWVMENFLPKEK